jgi:hypothetical protein
VPSRLRPTGWELSKAQLRCGSGLLVETLRAHGVGVADRGDLAIARWTADRADGRPNAWRKAPAPEWLA